MVATGSRTVVAAPAIHDRHAYRKRDVVRLYGPSLRSIDRAIAAGEIRTKKRGTAVFLHPGDVEQVFGFPDEDAPLKISAESVAEIEDLLA